MIITHKKVVIYIFYKINLWLYTQGPDFTLGIFLFGSFKWTKNADPDKYSYSGYDIEFDSRERLSLCDSNSFVKSVTIFGADRSLSMHIDNKKKDILILGKGPTDGLDDTILRLRNTIL